MKKTANDKDKSCPISDTTRVIGDFWIILIVRQLLTGPKRFNELEEAISDITPTTLSDRLKRLVESNLVGRHQYQCIPPKVEYTLTAQGEKLKGLIDEIEKFSSSWKV